MIPVDVFIRATTEPERPAPPRTRRPLWTVMLGDALSAATTVAIALLLLAAIPRLIDWAFVSAVWSGDGDRCRDAGACWAFLREKYRFILFGIYPPEQQWRPALMVAIVLGLTLWTMPSAHWTRTTLLLWVGGVLASLLLLGGGLFGLDRVPTSSWGGLPITLLLTLLSLAFGFPLAVALALGRRSRFATARLLATGFIELIRGLPLLSLLFIASVLLPIMLPEGMTIDNLFRALVALTFSAAAYLAEVLRGGLQSLPKGQEEAAFALGLSRGATLRRIVLPQAIRAVIPPLTNTAVVIVKNTSLVLVVGLFDLLSAGRATLADPDWPAPYVETYLMVATIYFAICFGISRYSLFLERTMVQGVRR
jgi:general L-amino acid transport system permease protein